MTSLLVFMGFRPCGRRPTCQPYGNVPVGVHSEKLERPFLDRGRPGDDRQQAFAMVRQAQLVQRHPREIVEQRAEAAGGQVVSSGFEFWGVSQTC